MYAGLERPADEACPTWQLPRELAAARRTERTLQVVDADPRAAAIGRRSPAPTRTTAASATIRDVCRVELRAGRGWCRVRRAAHDAEAPDRMSPSLHPRSTGRRRRFPTANWMPAWWPGPGSGKTTVLVEYFRRLVEAASIRCAFWPSPSPKRPPATCARSWRRRSSEQPATRAHWSAPGSPRCTASARACCGKTPSSRASTRSSPWPTSANRGACSRNPWRAAMDDVSSRASACHAGAHPRPLLARVRRGRPVGLRRHARRRSSRSEQLADFPVPAGVTVDANRRDAARPPRRSAAPAWSYAQKQHLEAALEGAERIVSAAGPLDALHAIEDFSCNLHKCKNGNRAYGLLKRMLKDRMIEEAEYALITASLRARTHSFCSKSCAASTALYRERKAPGRRARFRRPRRVRGAPAGGPSRCPRPRARPVRPHPDGRIPGHQRPAGQAARH